MVSCIGPCDIEQRHKDATEIIVYFKYLHILNYVICLCHSLSLVFLLLFCNNKTNKQKTPTFSTQLMLIKIIRNCFWLRQRYLVYIYIVANKKRRRVRREVATETTWSKVTKLLRVCLYFQTNAALKQSNTGNFPSVKR